MIVSGSSPTGSSYLVLNCSAMAAVLATCSKSISQSTSYSMWGSVDSSVLGGEPNNIYLGVISGTDGSVDPPPAPFGRAWSFLIFQLVNGSESGSIEVEGASWNRSATISTSVPTTVDQYSSPLNFSAAGPCYILSLDREAGQADIYAVWGTNDPSTRSPLSAAGGSPIGILQGGTEVGRESGAGQFPGASSNLIVNGYDYVIVMCVSTSGGGLRDVVGIATPNTGSTSGLTPATGPGTPWVLGGNQFGAGDAFLGTTDPNDTVSFGATGVGSSVEASASQNFNISAINGSSQRFAGTSIQDNATTTLAQTAGGAATRQGVSVADAATTGNCSRTANSANIVDSCVFGSYQLTCGSSATITCTNGFVSIGAQAGAVFIGATGGVVIAAGVATSPNSTCQLDVLSTTKGSRPWPTMTTAQAEAISGGAAGLKVQVSDVEPGNYEFINGSPYPFGFQVPEVTYQQGGGTFGRGSYPTFVAAAAACVALASIGFAPTLIIDGSLGAPVIPAAAGTVALPAGTVIKSRSTNQNQTLTIQSGAHLSLTDSLFLRGVDVVWQNTDAACISISGSDTSVSIFLRDGASIVADVSATQPFLSVSANAALDVDLQSSRLTATASAPICSTAAGVEVTFGIHSQSSVSANSFAGATGTIAANVDSTSSVSVPQGAALVYSGGLQVGNGSIVNGALTVSNVFLSASSVVHVSVGGPVPGSGNLTVRYDVLQSSRVIGLNGTGSFTINALVAAGTVNALDESTSVRWTIDGT